MFPALPRWVYTFTGCVLAALVFLQGDTLIPLQWKVYISAAVGLLHLFVEPAQGKPPKLPTLPLLVVAFLFALPCCAWFSSNKQALIPVEDAICVFGAEEAGLTPDQSAALCKITVDEVNQLLARKRAAYNAAKADGGAK